MAKALTAGAVAKLKPASQRAEIPDSGCPGLYLIVQPSGAKSWALRFRRPDGRPAKLALGSAYTNASKEPDAAPVLGGHLTLAAAHRLVAELRHQIAQGRDPAATHIADKARRRAAAVEGAANTFAVAARDFIEQYASRKVRRWPEQARLLGLNPHDLTLIPKGLADRWRNRPVTDITTGEIYELIEETRQRGAPGLERRSDSPTEARARAMLSCLSRLNRWLVQHRRIEQNPCAGVHRPAAPLARDRVLTNTEIARFWAATGDLAEPFGTVLRLLLLTGCRLNEVTGMRRAELSEDGASWNIPGARTKNRRPHTVPLSTLARKLLGEHSRQNDLIFSTTGTTPVSGWSKIKRRLDGTMVIPPWRIHDLRRTAVTGMAELGIRPDVIERLVNHISGHRAGVAGIYNRSELLLERRAALERWATHIAGLVSSKSATITSLNPRSA